MELKELSEEKREYYKEKVENLFFGQANIHEIDFCC